MDISEAIRERHSVRSYTDRPIPADVAEALKKEVEACNRESGLDIRLVLNEEKAFTGLLAHFGKFRGVKNYLVLAGKNNDDAATAAGYFGERIVLKAQTLGLNSCWVALTFKKGVVQKYCRLKKEEKIFCVVALGYGATQGVPHKSKRIEEVCTPEHLPKEWFRRGVESALLAPTALNRQNFMIEFDEEYESVLLYPKDGTSWGVDIGIVKYHFEIGAGKENFKWEED